MYVLSSILGIYVSTRLSIYLPICPICLLPCCVLIHPAMHPYLSTHELQLVWMDGWLDGWMDGWIDVHRYFCMYMYSICITHVCMHAWMGAQTDARLDAWLDAWPNCVLAAYMRIVFEGFHACSCICAPFAGNPSFPIQRGLPSLTARSPSRIPSRSPCRTGQALACMTRQAYFDTSALILQRADLKTLRLTGFADFCLLWQDHPAEQPAEPTETPAAARAPLHMLLTQTGTDSTLHPAGPGYRADARGRRF